MSIWQKIRFRFGMTWTRRSIIETIVCFIVITFMLWAGVWLYIRLTDYANVRNEAYLNKRLAYVREQKMLDCLRGNKIATLPAGFKLKDVYYCNVSALRFSTDTN